MQKVASENSDEDLYYSFETHSTDGHQDSPIGDLMGVREMGFKLPAGFKPLERVLLTANGNFQRIVSSYYNEPVFLDIVYNRKREDSPPDCPVYDRQITLTCKGQQFCVATSTVKLSSQRIIDLVEKDGIGIGQLFRNLKLVPTFRLLSCGRTSSCLWRVYNLNADNIECVIREECSANIFSIP
eukprot:Sdes_comp17625_c0_seq2m6890